jgi:hypothetical protein
MKKIKIENEDKLFRDMNSNALIFEDYHQASYEKKRRFFEEQEEERYSRNQVSYVQNTEYFGKIKEI